jgi:hypothetical protein
LSTVTTLHDFAVELLAHANNALATTAAGAIDRAFVSPALPAFDCCDQLTVDVRSIQTEMTAPITPIPVAGHRLQGAQGVLYLATLVVTDARCIPVAEQNALPSMAAMQEAAQVLNEDVWAIWNGLINLHRSGQLFNGKCVALYIDPPTPVPARGGCAGWEIRVRPQIDGYEVAIS